MNTQARDERSRGWSPLAKLALWAGATALLALVAQLCTLPLGAEYSIFTTGGGRSVLLALALIVLLYLMAYDQRSAAEYGLVVDRRWAWHALGGMGLGVAFYGAICVAAVGLGVFNLSLAGPSASTVATCLFAVVTAIPVAALQQIIFSGYLPSTIRQRHSVATSVMAPSLAFGLFAGMAEADGLLSYEGSSLAVGMFLIASLLCLVRLSLGNISLPAGMLAGAIVLRRVIRKLGLMAFNADHDWTLWVAPHGDPRQGPLMWAALGLCIAAAAIVLWRRGEYRLAANQPGLDASFKRIMPFSNLIGLAPLDLWIAKLWQARFRVGLVYLPRLCVTLIASAVNTVLTLPERVLAPRLLRRAVPDPVFIVGVHRSGTTHLHNLLSLDSRFCTPRNYQVFNPHGFMTGWLTTLVLGPFLTWRRPMDAVQLTAFSPQEEDFAIAGMCRFAPYWFGCFPRLFAEHERFIYPERMQPHERSAWRRAVELFLRKVSFWSRKSPLLKSPYNTARVAALREMFPRAKFIHIVRHPHATYRSNVHLAEHGWAVFQLQDADPQTSFASRILENYRDQEDAFYRDAAALPPHDVAEVRFEDLEGDAIGEVRKIYDALSLEFTPQFEARLRAYLESVAGYQKNRFKKLPADEQARVDAVMGDYARRWGYADDGSAAGKAA